MATPARSLGLRQAFTATSPKTPPVRHLHITGAQHQPSSFLTFQERMAEVGRKTERRAPPPPYPASRPFNTHRALKARGDASPIDLCYFPQRELPTNLEPELGRVPLIPLIPSAARPPLHDLQHGAPVHDLASGSIRRIATSSGVGVDEGTVTAMGEAEDDAEMEGFGTQKQGSRSTAAQRAAGDDTLTGEVRGVWHGFVDDLLGPRKG